MKGWICEFREYQPWLDFQLEGTFCQMNGYMGIRGYPEEASFGSDRIPRDDRDGMNSAPHQFVAGFFDRHAGGGDVMVNLPTARLIRLYVEDERLDLSSGSMSNYKRSLDMRDAVSFREFVWTSPEGRSSKIEFSSFLSYPRMHIHASSITVTPLNWSGMLMLEDSFDSRGKTLRHQHYQTTEKGALKDGHFCKIQTYSSKLEAVLASCWRFPEKTCVHASLHDDNENVFQNRIRILVQSGSPCVCTRFLSVCSSCDAEQQHPGQKLEDRAASLVYEARDIQWRGLLDEQQKAWAKLWEDASIGINGDEESEKKLRFHVFQLLQSYRGDPRFAVGPHFLSGEKGGGRYNRDNESFLFPFFLHVIPKSAESLLLFRLKSLDGAKAKALKNGCKGAFFPWEASPLSQDENSPEWAEDGSNVPIPVSYGKACLHINATIIYSLHHFMRMTGKGIEEIPRAAELVSECARFWASRGTWENGIFSIKSVIGPDEYHQFINDNAYSNHMAKFCLEWALELDVQKNGRLLQDQERDEFRRIASHIMLGHNNQRGIIAQDSSYLSLPDFKWEKFDRRKPLSAQVTRSDLSGSQISSEPDLIALFQALPDRYNQGLMRRCFDYYLPRCSPAESSHSPGILATVAAFLDKKEEALEFYRSCLNMDFQAVVAETGASEGLHAANSGNAWIATIMGFAGLSSDFDALYCMPHLPEKWKALSFSIYFRYRKISFKISQNFIEVRAKQGQELLLILEGVPVSLPSKDYSLDYKRAHASK
ncbi:MAG: hypothetical protein A2X49_00965 [Lentisphaerae bacterium GWF2_52_8]|nr:MAG: hypothetical protein A2X49_00965 [Lentisphaerae bacterium GWF2_52_8]